MKLLKQSTAYNLVILMVDSTDHVTGKTGLTLTLTASKDGGAYASITPTVTELSYGLYKLALTTSHTDTVGDLAIHATGTGADPTDIIVQIRAVTTDDLVRSTTPANTFDVSATGEGGLDFSNIKAASGATTLTNITVPTVTSVTNDVGITQTGADKVWSTSTRTLSSFGTLVSDIWSSGTRTLTSFGTLVSDIWSNATRTLSSFGTLAADVWTNSTRTLTSGGGGGGATAQEVWEYSTRALTDKADFALSSTSRAAVVDEVWDEVLTGATHNVSSSSGRRLRQLASNIIYSGTAASGGTNYIIFDSGASSVNGAYDPAMVTIVAGTGIGQTRLVYQYEGSTRKAWVDRDWKVEPDNTSEFMILADAGREHVNEGVAQGGGTDTITLNASASSHDDAYIGQIVFIKAGTGQDQASHVIDYNGTTKVATVYKNWATQPDTTSVYVMLPQGMLDLAQLVADVWSNSTRTLTSGGGGATAQDVWEYGTRELTGGVTASVAVSATEALSVSTGSMELKPYYTLAETVTSTTTSNVSGATKLWFSIKDIGETDANSLIFMEKTAGLTVVNKTSYATTTHGSLVVSGSSGDWSVLVKVDEAATTNLAPYNNKNYEASLKALISGDAISIWDGECRITNGVIRTIS